MTSSRDHRSTGVGAMLSVFPEHRNLIVDLCRRDVSSRYTGTMAGTFWSFASPLIMLGIYTLVFGQVFGAKWNQTGSTLDFALMLFVGIIFLNLFNECITKAPGIIVENAMFVKKVPFPLAVYPWVILGSALFHAAVSLGALLVFNAVASGELHWQVLYLPVLVLPLLLICLGLMYFLCSAGVYLRDIGQVVGLLAQALLFLSPIFYSYAQAPAGLRSVLAANPLTYVIEDARIVILEGGSPDWNSSLILFVLGAAMYWLGFVWFQKTRNGFTDVL